MPNLTWLFSGLSLCCRALSNSAGGLHCGGLGANHWLLLYLSGSVSLGKAAELSGLHVTVVHRHRQGSCMFKATAHLQDARLHCVATLGLRGWVLAAARWSPACGGYTQTNQTTPQAFCRLTKEEELSQRPLCILYWSKSGKNRQPRPRKHWTMHHTHKGLCEADKWCSTSV